MQDNLEMIREKIERISEGSYRGNKACFLPIFFWTD